MDEYNIKVLWNPELRHVKCLSSTYWEFYFAGRWKAHLFWTVAGYVWQPHLPSWPGRILSLQICALWSSQRSLAIPFQVNTYSWKVKYFWDVNIIAFYFQESTWEQGHFAEAWGWEGTLAKGALFQNKERQDHRNPQRRIPACRIWQTAPVDINSSSWQPAKQCRTYDRVTYWF